MVDAFLGLGRAFLGLGRLGPAQGGRQEREDNTGTCTPFVGVLSRSQALQGLEKLETGVYNLEKPRPGLPASHLTHCPGQVNVITACATVRLRGAMEPSVWMGLGVSQGRLTNRCNT